MKKLNILESTFDSKLKKKYLETKFQKIQSINEA